MIRELNHQRLFPASRGPSILPTTDRRASACRVQRRRRLHKNVTKKWVRATSNLIAFIPFRSIRQILATFSKGLYRSSGKEKENRCLGRFPWFIKKFRKFRNGYVNETYVFGAFHWKVPGNKCNFGKVAFFCRWKFSVEVHVPFTNNHQL